MDTAESDAGAGPLLRSEDEARRITAATRERGITAQLVGGIAVFLRCPCALEPPLRRDYKDIDLVTTRSMSGRLTEVLTTLGHHPDKRFNSLNAGRRLFFWDESNGRQLDVFVDRFEMCHGFDLKSRLAVDPTSATLPLADLLLTKMQVVELNHKDTVDIAALLQDQPFTEDESGINLAYIVSLTRSDWGLQRTIEKTIEKLSDPQTLRALRAEAPHHALEDQLATLAKAMADAPKSTSWKLRDRIGERKRWYELPEEARA